MELRPYQSEALEAIHAACQRGVHRQLLALPTGGGKTVVFSELVNRREGRALVLAHRDRLIQQAASKLASVVGYHRLGIVKSDQNQFNAGVVVASVQTLSRSRRLEMMPKFDTVIIDEAHRSAARIYTKIIDHVCGPDTLLLGVTATPERTDGIGLDSVYEEIVYQVGIMDLIDQGYLVPLRGRKITIEVDFSSLKSRRTADGFMDYRMDEVENLMEAGNWHENVAKGWLRFASDRRTIAFVPRVKMAYRLAEYLREQGIAAAALDGSTTLGEQRRLVHQFETGAIRFLANCDLFVEGADIPSIDCVLFARPTKSRIIYNQAIGRGTRLSPETGKTDCLVLDMVGASNRFDLCHLGTLAGVREVQPGETLREARQRQDEEDAAAAAEKQRESLDGILHGHEVDLFTGTRSAQKFDWQVFPEQQFAILKLNTMTWRVWRESDADNAPYYFEEISRQSPLQGAADTYLEACTACETDYKLWQFGGPQASWRSTPATEKQLLLLRKLRIKHEPTTITKGEAARLIDERFARSQLQRA